MSVVVIIIIIIIIIIGFRRGVLPRDNANSDKGSSLVCRLGRHRFTLRPAGMESVLRAKPGAAKLVAKPPILSVHGVGKRRTAFESFSSPTLCRKSSDVR